MIVYLAAYKSLEGHWNKPTNDIYLLSSFWEHKSGKYGKYVTQEKHILDSGAFSMLKGKTNVNFFDYTKKYCDFINKTNQKLFFELDIYKIIGTQKTEELRDYIEQKTGKACIPVWHKHLGLEYLHKLSEKYSYIAFGGFAIKDIKKSEYKYIPKLLEICKKNNCKVHGLGFTSIPMLKYLKFYSVDSTAWQQVRYGGVCLFNGESIKNYRKENFKMKNVYNLHVHNFNQWVKFQKWAKNNL